MDDFKNEAVALKKEKGLMIGDFKSIEYIPGRMMMSRLSNPETVVDIKGSYWSLGRLSSSYRGGGGGGAYSNGALG